MVFNSSHLVPTREVLWKKQQHFFCNCLQFVKKKCTKTPHSVDDEDEAFVDRQLEALGLGADFSDELIVS